MLSLLDALVCLSGRCLFLLRKNIKMKVAFEVPLAQCNHSDFLKLCIHMNCSCAIFCLGKALAGSRRVYFYMPKAPTNLK